MSASTKDTFLCELEGKINIDVDSLNTEFIRTLPITPNDQTCNPIWLMLALQDPSSADLIKETALEFQEQDFLAICSRLAVRLCASNIDLINGRVLVQTSPSGANSFQKTLDHAHLYVSEFERVGIPKDRYCIKIMATGAGLNAAKVLQNEGISTLGTGVFSVAQAVACSQAGCLYISPYYNEIRTHLDPSLWPDVADPALEHPFSSRIAQMIQAYKHMFAKTSKQQPLIKNAGFRSYREVIASVELGCHSATISRDTLEEMKAVSTGQVALPDVAKVASLQSPYASHVAIPVRRLERLLGCDPLVRLAEGETWSPTDLRIDYLANEGKALEQAIGMDEATTRMVKDALDMFVHCEEETRKLIEGLAPTASL